MSKHTEGPWGVGGLDRAGQRIIENEHIEIATCWHHGVASIETEMEANAHLMAAAPELLEALKLARDGLSWYQLTNPEYVNGCDYEAMEHIDGVIAKAEGKTVEEN